jgi:hypothetical protein
MNIVYKSLDNFTKMVVFILSRTFFGNIYKFVNGFRNIKNINKNNYKYEEYILGIYKYYEYDYKNITN